ALCDAHGFLVTAKHEDSTNGVESRQRINKNTLIDFSYALALPDRHHETIQLHTRSGASKEEGQMLMKMSARSGDYALGVRYHCVGVGADTEHWNLIVTDAQVRRKRHRAILGALRDSLISPEGAFTATMLPHLTSLTGCIVAIETAGRAPLYSALQPDFIERLQVMQTSTSHLYAFESIDTFFTHMNWLIEMTIPATSKVWDPQDISLSAGVVPQTGEDQSL
ncbi:MAG: hypothetical protein J2P36_36345, partial [Ktedonobacteraceae bacterium]|nr:hypothetical protein [Ktedonobacteraceae bacterium]